MKFPVPADEKLLSESLTLYILDLVCSISLLVLRSFRIRESILVLASMDCLGFQTVDYDSLWYLSFCATLALYWLAGIKGEALVYLESSRLAVTGYTSAREEPLVTP